VGDDRRKCREAAFAESLRNGVQPQNLYSTSGTVSIKRGRLGSSSTVRRKFEIDDRGCEDFAAAINE